MRAHIDAFQSKIIGEFVPMAGACPKNSLRTIEHFLTAAIIHSDRIAKR